MYEYTRDLVALDRCQSPEVDRVAKELYSGVATPLRVDEWATLLEAHPDRQFVQYILSGIANGFRIGFQTPGQGSFPRPEKTSIPRRNTHKWSETT